MLYASTITNSYGTTLITSGDTALHNIKSGPFDPFSLATFDLPRSLGVRHGPNSYSKTLAKRRKIPCLRQPP